MIDYTKLGSTNNLALIISVITGRDEVDKAWVVSNPRLTDVQMMTLADDEDIVVRRELAKVSHLPADVLRLLCADKAEIVRVHALCNPLTVFSDFMVAVLTGKFSVSSKKLFCQNFRVLGSLEVFEFLWRTVKGAQPILINTLNVAVRDASPLIDSKVLNFVHDEIRAGDAPNAVREAYAESVWLALPEILDSLKDDVFRPVINAITRNGSAWVSTHEYLVDNHKSSLIRCFIAMVTEDNDLLNKIYHGTKSKDIRYWVECNPVFVFK